MNDWTTKTHAIAAAVAGAAVVGSAIVPGHDIMVVCLAAGLPLAASLLALALSRGVWSKDLLAVLTVELAVLLLFPRFYIFVRCQHDTGRVVELAEQSRIGEARALAHEVLSLSPQATWNGMSLKLAADNLDGAAREIEQRINGPLPNDADVDRCLARARDLAMLGRTNDALQTLDAAPGASDSPEASNLRGTIYETRGAWREARKEYRRVESGWREREVSTQRTAGLVRAVTGIAFCERKLGRLREAEAAWLKRLELSPTAESNFLLAQFYEDTQHTQKASFHAEEAMRLAPERYAQKGRQLLDKLVTSHFGCLGVFRAESSPGSPFGATTIESK
jgi:hypothetical protein